MTTPFYIENAAAKPLNVPMLKWLFTHTLAKPEDSAKEAVAVAASDLNAAFNGQATPKTAAK